jgi:hypothetical protein
MSAAIADKGSTTREGMTQNYRSYALPVSGAQATRDNCNNQQAKEVIWVDLMPLKPSGPGSRAASTSELFHVWQ